MSQEDRIIAWIIGIYCLSLGLKKLIMVKMA